MILLPEATFPLIGIGYRGVFVGYLLLHIDRREHNAPSARPHHPEHLSHGQTIVLNMLENMVTKNNIELIIGKRNLLNIHLDLCQRRFEICSHIIEFRQPLESLDETIFGSDVQQPGRRFEKVGLVLQIEP